MATATVSAKDILERRRIQQEQAQASLDVRRQAVENKAPERRPDYGDVARGYGVAPNIGLVRTLKGASQMDPGADVMDLSIRRTPGAEEALLDPEIEAFLARKNAAAEKAKAAAMGKKLDPERKAQTDRKLDQGSTANDRQYADKMLKAAQTALDGAAPKDQEAARQRLSEAQQRADALAPNAGGGAGGGRDSGFGALASLFGFGPMDFNPDDDDPTEGDGPVVQPTGPDPAKLAAMRDGPDAIRGPEAGAGPGWFARNRTEGGGVEGTGTVYREVERPARQETPSALPVGRDEPMQGGAPTQQSQPAQQSPMVTPAAQPAGIQMVKMSPERYAKFDATRQAKLAAETGAQVGMAPKPTSPAGEALAKRDEIRASMDDVSGGRMSANDGTPAITQDMLNPKREPAKMAEPAPVRGEESIARPAPAPEAPSAWTRAAGRVQQRMDVESPSYAIRDGMFGGDGGGISPVFPEDAIRANMALRPAATIAPTPAGPGAPVVPSPFEDRMDPAFYGSANDASGGYAPGPPELFRPPDNRMAPESGYGHGGQMMTPEDRRNALLAQYAALMGQ